MTNFRRTNTESNDAKMISNQLFVSLVRYGKIVESLYDKQLKEKYASLYKQFISLQKQLNKTLDNN